jgi:hypothetical protein
MSLLYECQIGVNGIVVSLCRFVRVLGHVPLCEFYVWWLVFLWSYGVHVWTQTGICVRACVFSGVK